jgi:hypothetical protein
MKLLSSIISTPLKILLDFRQIYLKFKTIQNLNLDLKIRGTVGGIVCFGFAFEGTLRARLWFDEKDLPILRRFSALI